MLVLASRQRQLHSLMSPICFLPAVQARYGHGPPIHSIQGKMSKDSGTHKRFPRGKRTGHGNSESSGQGMYIQVF